MFTITDNTDQNHMTAAMFKRAVKIAGLTMEPFDPSTVNTPDFTAATAAEVSEAAYQAALDGRDPSQDKGVQKLLTSHQLGAVIGGMYHRNQVALSHAELAHYQSEAPSLLEELTDQFEDATTTMSDALELVGHISLDDGLGRIGNMPDSHERAITAAYMANRRTAAILESLPVIIAAATGQKPEAGQKFQTLVYADATPEQFIEYRLNTEGPRNYMGHDHNVWDVIGAGITIKLVTTKDELDARINRIQNPDAPRDYRAEEARRDDSRAMAKALGIN